MATRISQLKVLPLTKSNTYGSMVLTCIAYILPL